MKLVKSDEKISFKELIEEIKKAYYIEKLQLNWSQLNTKQSGKLYEWNSPFSKLREEMKENCMWEDLAELDNANTLNHLNYKAQKELIDSFLELFKETPLFFKKIKLGFFNKKNGETQQIIKFYRITDEYVLNYMDFTEDDDPRPEIKM